MPFVVNQYVGFAQVIAVSPNTPSPDVAMISAITSSMRYICFA
jgi:hypothetical protein